jgi:hypothetical protein
MGTLLAALVLPFAAAWGVLGATPVRADRLLRACTAFGLAVGLSSCGFFLWLALAGPAYGHQAFVEAVVVGGVLLGYLLLFGRRTACAVVEPQPASESGVWERLLAVGFLATLAGAIARFVLVSVTCPHGHYDAWAIWNMRARFLYRGGEYWREAFLIEKAHIDWSHPDYPLLLPGTIARCWYYAESETQLVPVLIAGLFTFATVGLLVASLGLLRGRAQGLLAGIVLSATAFFVDLGSSQYADVPLGFFVLLAVTLVCLHDHLPGGDYRLLVLAGIAAALAAWTKNEGQLALAAIVVARVVCRRRSAGWRRAVAELGPFWLGLLPGLTVLAYFKVEFAPANDLLSGQGIDTTTARLTDPHRYSQISVAFAKELRRLGPGALGLLAVYAVLLRGAPRAARAGSAFPFAFLGLMLAGYGTVYLTTPRPLDWHLFTSLDRLLMHLWPTALLAFFLVVATPAEATARRPGEESLVATLAARLRVVFGRRQSPFG